MRNIGVWLGVFLSAVLVSAAPFGAAFAAEEEYTATLTRYEYRLPDLSVIGSPTWLKPAKKDNLLEVARRYGLGFNEVAALYPRTDAWILPTNRKLLIPTFWVLPPTQHEQLVINVAEMRLYYFEKSRGTVQTNPIGIGDEGWETPLGSFHITEKRPNPSWYIPASLQAQYGMAVMPPGPDNPLGEYMMKFSAGAYGVHGTSMPWGVGRLVSHGCIRCYPEHIRILYPQVAIGTRLEIIYEPIKFGQKDGQVYAEVHPDVYRKLPDFEQYAMNKLDQSGLADQVDRRRYAVAVRLQSGLPMNVGKLSAEDISTKRVELSQ